MFISNAQYYLKSTITSTQAAGTTFLLSTDFEQADNLETGTDTVSMVLKNGTQIERFEITATGGTATIVKRWLTQAATSTADVGYQKQWTEGSIAYVSALAFDLFDKQGDTMTGLLEIVTYADLATLQATYPVAPNWTSAYCTTEGQFYDGVGGSWVARASGTNPNASATVAGKVEIATTAETQSGASTGGTGALLSALPSDIASNTQSGTFVYTNSTTGSDTYTANLTPALTAYTTGMSVRVKFDTVNTGACSINLNSLGAKSIKLIDGSDPLDGDIAAGSINDLIYNGTDFVLQSVAVRATDAIASAWTSKITYVTPKQATLVTTGFTNISTTSGNSSVFTATKTGYVNMELEATHRDDQIGGVTSKIEFSTDGGSNYSTVKSVVNNSTGGGGTTTTNRWYWVWFVNIGMKIRANVTVTSSGSWVAAFDYIN